MTDDQKAKFLDLIARARDQGYTDAQEISDWANVDMVMTRSESERPTVPVTPTTGDLIGAIDGASIRQILQLPGFRDIIAAATGTDIRSAMDWIGGLAKAGILTSTDLANIQALTQRTQPDPDWDPVIREPSPWIQAFGSTSFDLPDGSAIAGGCDPRLIQPLLSETGA